MRNFIVGLSIPIIAFVVIWYALLAAERHAVDYQECGGVYCSKDETK